MNLTQKIERSLGGLKFAVTLILLFAIAMIIGTFLESYFGTDFANRTIYKTPFFMLIQFGMFICIIFAALLRLPPKRRLYGFYTIHSGLIIIGCGSFITYYAGVDGSIVLDPQTPSRQVILNDDILKIHYPEDGRVITYQLPYTAFQKEINQSFEDIELLTYLPFAEKIFTWKDPQDPLPRNTSTHSGRYLIANENIAQEFTLSLHPAAFDFKNSLTLGPLSVHYLPQGLAKCFNQKNPSKVILWDQRTAECFTPEERKVLIKKTKTKANPKRFFVIREGESLYSFFPDLSPWPMDKDFQIDKKSPIRVFSKKIFETKANLFIFGEFATYYDKDEDLWSTIPLIEKKPIDLPWMGLQLTLKKHHTQKIPTHIPTYTRPIQDNNQIIKGSTRALKIQVRKKSYWVTRESPLQLMIDGKRVVFQLLKSSLTLPFEFVLTKFKMDKDPGTNRAASYESFVRLFSAKGPQEAHVYMNNPLKHAGFTFYQASYSQDRQGNYSSTLSANYDPGRFWKYLGSLLLVLGSLWHYYLNHHKKKKSNLNEALVPGTEGPI